MPAERPKPVLLSSTSDVTQGKKANGRVVVAGVVVHERVKTSGRVAAAGGVVVKCVNPGGRVARAVRIACERSITRSGIDDANSVG